MRDSTKAAHSETEEAVCSCEFCALSAMAANTLAVCRCLQSLLVICHIITSMLYALHCYYKATLTIMA